MTGALAAMQLREAGVDDAGALVRLSGELGYPAATQQVRKRFEQGMGDRGYALFVAVNGGDAVGWIQLAEQHSVLSNPSAERTGLVIDARHRSAGVGRLLVQRAEDWARERGLGAMGVRSNVLRERAHQFYLRLGYSMIKSQKVFRKPL